MCSALFGLAFAFSIGILLNVLACVLKLNDDVPQNFYPLIVIVFYFLAPFPNLMCGNCGGELDFSSSGKMYRDAGYFLTGFLIVSGLALPLVLAHAQTISGGAAALCTIGGVIVFASVAGCTLCVA